MKTFSSFWGFSRWREFRKWSERLYGVPCPSFVKQAVLARNGFPGAIWVESGTFLGVTTRFLANFGSFVYTIEPGPNLYKSAQLKLGSLSNVKVINGLSEEVFPSLLPTLSGDLNFWLDGHYSAGGTHRGPKDTPILDELESISLNRKNFSSVCVLIDDVRCFNPRLEEYSTYPDVRSLIDWAEAEHFHWHIEHDIFVARSAAPD